MKKHLLLFSLLLCMSFLFGAKTLIVQGNIKVLAVGEGMSGGMTSQVSDFKKVGLIVNERDTLVTETNEVGEFIFPAIKENDIFQVYFFYHHSNNYLNKTEYLIPKGKNAIQTKNVPKEEIGYPLLSDYKITVKGNQKTINLSYGLYLLISKPYEPAGFKLMDYPLNEAPFQEIMFPNQLSLKTQEALKGHIKMITQFSYKIEKDTILTPVYNGFYLQFVNLDNANGNCFKGDMNQIEIPCDLKNLVIEIHDLCVKTPVSFKRYMLGKNFGSMYFTPHVLMKIETDPNRIDKKENVLEDSDPPHLLSFVVKNETKKTIQAVFGELSELYNTAVVRNETDIKKNQSKTIAFTKFSMNNPLNYKAKIWENYFPKELFKGLTIYYGKKKIKILVEENWKLDKVSDLEYIYTLTVKV